MNKSKLAIISQAVILMLGIKVGYATVQHSNALVSMQQERGHGNNYVYSDMKPISEINISDSNKSMVFRSQVITVGDAINQLLKNADYKLSQSNKQNKYVQAMLASKLPKSKKKLQNTTVQQALVDLTDGSFDVVVEPIQREISFSVKPSKKSSLAITQTDVVANKVYSPIKEYFKHSDYETRVSQPLIEAGLSKSPSHKALVKFNQKQKLYFSFNKKDQIVAIAQSQKEANALASKDKKVFYALVGQTLEQTIKRWAKQDGFKVLYFAKKDFVFDVGNTFYGSLNAKDGALAQLLSAATQAGVNIQAQVHTNHVLVIKDQTYSPILLGGSNDE